jgi:hypothetical protein
MQVKVVLQGTDGSVEAPPIIDKSLNLEALLVLAGKQYLYENCVPMTTHSCNVMIKPQLVPNTIVSIRGLSYIITGWKVSLPKYQYTLTLERYNV